MEYKLFASKCNEAFLANQVVALSSNAVEYYTDQLKRAPNNKYLPELISIYKTRIEGAQGVADAAMETVIKMEGEYNFDMVSVGSGYTLSTSVNTRTTFKVSNASVWLLQYPPVTNPENGKQAWSYNTFKAHKMAALRSQQMDQLADAAAAVGEGLLAGEEEVPAVGEKEVSAVGEEEVQAVGEGEVPAVGEGEVPVVGEGEKTAGGEEEETTAGGEEMPASKVENTASKRQTRYGMKRILQSSQASSTKKPRKA